MREKAYKNIYEIEIKLDAINQNHLLVNSKEARIENFFFANEIANEDALNYFWNNLNNLEQVKADIKIDKTKQNEMIKWVISKFKMANEINDVQERYLVKYLTEELIIGNNMKYDVTHLISNNLSNYQDLIWFLHKKILLNLEETRVYYKNTFDNMDEYHVIGEKADIEIYDEETRLNYRDFEHSSVYYQIAGVNKVGRHIFYINSNYRVKIINKKPDTLKKPKYILFMDRLEKGGDNAEHMFKYMLERGDKNSYFVIGDKEQYKAYKRKYKNVLLFGSFKFKWYYKNAKLLVSSGLDSTFLNYKGIRNKYRIKYLFLQHGYITDDLSNWIMGKKYDYIIVSDALEAKNVSGYYSVHPEQVKQIGLARYDQLKRNDKGNIILIAPTWRYYLKSKLEGSEYVIKWNQVLKSEKLKRYAEANNLKIVLKLHPEFEKYHEYFDAENSKREYTDLINNTELLITDYSSIFMDVHIRNKPVVFYQFDIEEFYQNHTYGQLLEYKDLGIGTVCSNLNQVLNTLNNEPKNIVNDTSELNNREKTYELIQEMINDNSVKGLSE